MSYSRLILSQRPQYPGIESVPKSAPLKIRIQRKI